MAHGMPSQGKVTISVDEYSSNPTQAFTHYNINQSRFQPPHVHMWVTKDDGTEKCCFFKIYISFMIVIQFSFSYSVLFSLWKKKKKMYQFICFS